VWFIACSKGTVPTSTSSGSTSSASAFASPKATPFLTTSDVNAIRELVAPAQIASQRDTFGEIAFKKPSGFEVSARGSVAVVQMEGISPFLVDCDGEITTTDGGTVPYSLTVTAEFGAYQMANLSPSVFSRVAAVDALELRLATHVHDKYGQPEEWEFFKSIVTRAQASKMDWKWFKTAVLRSTFDPSAFDQFDLFFGNPPTAQDKGLLLRALQEDSEHASEAYDSEVDRERVLKWSIQMANWSNCTR
jgi:hypothetical protein